MDLIYFVVKYTPFWAVPCFMISSQFGYIYWLKDARRISYTLFLFSLFCLIMILYYIFSGGPDGSVQALMRFMNDI